MQGGMMCNFEEKTSIYLDRCFQYYIYVGTRIIVICNSYQSSWFQNRNYTSFFKKRISPIKLPKGKNMKATCVVLSYGTLLLGLSYGWQPRPFQQLTSSFGQHHKHNEEGHKVRRLQRLLLHNNGHTMQFRNEGKLSKCNALAIYKLYLSTNNKGYSWLKSQLCQTFKFVQMPQTYNSNCFRFFILSYICCYLLAN